MHFTYVSVFVADATRALAVKQSTPARPLFSNLLQSYKSRKTGSLDFMFSALRILLVINLTIWIPWSVGLKFAVHDRYCWQSIFKSTLAIWWDKEPSSIYLTTSIIPVDEECSFWWMTNDGKVIMRLALHIIPWSLSQSIFGKPVFFVSVDGVEK